MRKESQINRLICYKLHREYLVFINCVASRNGIGKRIVEIHNFAVTH